MKFVGGNLVDYNLAMGGLIKQQVLPVLNIPDDGDENFDFVLQTCTKREQRNIVFAVLIFVWLGMGLRKQKLFIKWR